MIVTGGGEGAAVLSCCHGRMREHLWVLYVVAKVAYSS